MHFRRLQAGNWARIAGTARAEDTQCRAREPNPSGPEMSRRNHEAHSDPIDPGNCYRIGVLRVGLCKVYPPASDS